jgi:3-dehydrosphinganine reductase
MYTPGFDEESKMKPEIVKEIESTDKGMTTDQAAQALFKG